MYYKSLIYCTYRCIVRTGRDSATKLAGELGFEPRSSVLETDSLTVELTPPRSSY